jgi:RNA polymerase sigma factor (sigma-70 family)
MDAQNHIVMTNAPLDLPACIHLVAAYLLKQEWRLVEPTTLAETIYQELAGQALVGQSAVHAVQTQIWQQYAVILHDACRQPETAVYERAWQELAHWLGQQRKHLPWSAEEREDVVQETVAALKVQLEKSGIKAPRAFLMYALQALRRTAIDEERKRTAVMRGSGHDPLSWELLSEAAPEPETAAPSEHLPRAKLPERRTENTVSDHEIRTQLKKFFRQHLHGEQQILVAEMLFLEDLSPKEIAGLLQKQPHEIRMIKFRIVQTLRSLPAAEQQKLLAILGQPDKDEENGQ